MSFFFSVFGFNITVDVIIRTVILIFRIGLGDQVVDKIERVLQLFPVFLIVLCRISEVADTKIVPPVAVPFQFRLHNPRPDKAR